VKELTVNWNSIGGMRFEATGPTGYTVLMDTVKEFGGDDQGMTPKYLLLAALGGCSGMDVISMLRKMRQDVTAYRIELKADEHEEHPQKYDRIIAEHIVEGHNLNQEMVERAVRLSHEKYCTVAASLAGSVEIKMTARLVEAAPEATVK
jgi:putative redox protein